MSSKHTPEAQILKTLQELNPFSGRTVTKSHHIWEENFLDIASINANVSEQIFDSIKLAKHNNATLGVAVVAPKGTGKTHILSRIRHQLKTNNQGCFIYLCEYGNLAFIKSHFLQGLAISLNKQGGSGTTQWQELATTLINSVVSSSNQPEKLVSQFHQVVKKNPTIVHQITDRILQHYEIDNPNVVRAIIWTLSKPHAPYAINWLAGRDLSENQAKFLDLPEFSTENRSGEAFEMAIQILNLIASYTVPVICFDELDAAESADENDETVGGFTRAMSVTSLAKDVYNNLKCGLIITSVYKRTLQDQIKASFAMDSVVERLIEKELALSTLRDEDIIELISNHLRVFYHSQQISPPHKLYPFSEKQLQELGEARLTTREALQWCSKNIPSGVVSPTKQLEKIYQEVQSNLDNYLEDNELIAESIGHGFKRLRGRTIDGVNLIDIEENIKPYSKHYGCIQFRLIVEEQGKTEKIGIAVAQYSHGKSVGAAIKYLTNYQDFDLSRGCLVRQKTIPAHWQVANQYLEMLQTEQGGEWVSFEDSEIQSLITLYKMQDEIDWDEFTPEDFAMFIEERHPLDHNPILLEILSNPSGEAPKNVIDTESTLEVLFSQNVDGESADASGSDLELALTAH
jgi:hypothetical protein